MKKWAGLLNLNLIKLWVIGASLLLPGLANANTWTKIANEGATFKVSGTQTVRFGANTSWVQKKVTNKGTCNVRFFGSDPARGVVKECQVLNATALKNSLGTNDPLGDKQWNLNAINLHAARNLLVGNTNKIRVAVIDTGYFNHPDVRWANDTDAAGRRLWRTGKPIDSSPSRTTGLDGAPHGLHVAGIIAGVANNGIGIAGVCDQCEVIPLFTPIIDKGVSDSIRDAVRFGAQVINMSIASTLSCNDSGRKLTRDAIAAAINAGVVVVSSAGNHNDVGFVFDGGQASNSVQKDITDISPAGCPGVISVGATDQTGQMAPYSHRGAVLMAPGGGLNSPEGAYGTGIDCTDIPQNKTEGIVSAWWSGSNGGSPCYRHLSGTSMSAPHVAGVIGLMLAANPGLSPKQVKDILVAQATPIPGCSAAICGAGLVNAGNAVATALQTSPAPLAANEWRTSTYKGVCKYAVSFTEPCKLDTIDELPNGNISVTAYGFMWNFNPSGALLSGPTLLTSLPAYARTGGPCDCPDGLCTNKDRVNNPSSICQIDTRTVIEYPGIGYIDSIQSRMRYWNFDAAGNPLGAQGQAIASVQRYGFICGVDCNFDTRALVNYPEWGGVVESITYNGRYYNYDGAGNMLPGAAGQGELTNVIRFDQPPLPGVARYGQICALNTTGQPCKFDTRELKANRNEVITAYGYYFEFSGDTLVNRYELKSPTFCIGPGNCNPFQ